MDIEKATFAGIPALIYGAPSDKAFLYVHGRYSKKEEAESFASCLFVSPILDMERLILNMMRWSNVTEERLKTEKRIETSFGETLSWEYYDFVRNHPITRWDSPTSILYGENDNLTERSVLDAFARKFHCRVTVMKDGEHYFHTPEQLRFLQDWIEGQEYERLRLWFAC